MSVRAPLLLSLLASLACTKSSAQGGPPKVPPARSVSAAERRVVEPIFQQGLGEGWMDFGWSPRTVEPGAPATVDLSGYGGWIVAKPGRPASFGGLAFRLKAPRDAPIKLFLKTEGQPEYPQVKLRADHVVEEKDGWRSLYVSMAELNPQDRTFDQLVFLGDTRGALAGIQLEDIGLTAGSPSRAAGGAPASSGAPVSKSVAVDCAAPGSPISPYIYGIAQNPMGFADRHPFLLGATIRRWGGNHTSRYNWKLGNAWNTGADWYFENVNYSGRPDYSYHHFLEENRAHELETALVLPMLGWVAKDLTSSGFPRARYPEQQSFDPYRPSAGNGRAPDGKHLPPLSPEVSSVPAPPEFIAGWVSTLKKADKGGARSVRLYILDNEPMLWSETHRDVHPQPLSYDELLDRTIRYITAIRKADPDAVIAGPAEWGWTNYLYSAVDTAAGVRLRPDRRKHGDLPLIVWYLQQLRAHEKKSGLKMLDVLDLHFYPQTEAGIFGDSAKVDAKNAALRIRSTRGLWDKRYDDESWIDQPVFLIPRMQAWIADNYPGLKTAIGEYNFGAEGHMSGGIAQAEALGRFGQQGLDYAFFWTYPPEGSPAFWAFRAFRNYDGKGSRFLERSLSTRDAEGLSLFASTDATKEKLVLVALNQDPTRAARTTLTLEGCGERAIARAFTYTGAPEGFTPLTGLPTKGGAEVVLPPYSINVLELLP